MSNRTNPISSYTEKPAEINSGAVLARKLGLSIGSGTPCLCSWNLSLRDTGNEPYGKVPISEILSVSYMQQLASVYFAEVQPVYNLLEQAMVDRAILSMSPDQPLFDLSHCVLLAVAALACLFSDQPRAWRRGLYTMPAPLSSTQLR